MLASFGAVRGPSAGAVPPGCHNKVRRKRSTKDQLRSVSHGAPCETRTVLAGAAEAQHAEMGTSEAPTIQDVYSAADRLLKERFGKKKHDVDQDKVQSYQRQYFHACLTFAQDHSSDPQALVDLMACVKRARPVTVGAVIKEVERRAIPLAHLFTWEQAATLITTINACQPQYGGQIASKFCSRWTSQRGLRDLEASDNLQKLLNMFSVAASTGHASNEHARIIMRYLDTRKDQVTLPVVMGLTKALRDAKILDTSADLKVLLQALGDSLNEHSSPLSALSASSTDAALLLCRLDTLGMRPQPSSSKSSTGSTSKGAGGEKGSDKKSKSKAREEVPLAELLTRRLAIEADAVPPDLLVCATLASSTLLGYMHVPLVKATVRRLNDVSAVRLLDVGALQAALQTLTASRQLASYNKLQGTIVRQALKHQGSQQQPSQADYLAARKAADSSPLPVSRDALCGAVENVLSVLCLHMRLILDDEGLSTLPPPPVKLSETTRTLPRHLINAGEGQPANVWISLLFDATRMDLWAAGHAALGRELIWSQAALMRVSWQVLAEEQAAANEAPMSAPLPTPARALQRLLWCHAHHSLPFPEQASHIVADMLVPRIHNLTCEEVSVAFWSIASLELRHAELASGLSTSVTRHLDQLHAEGAAHILGSMAALSVRDTWLVDSLCTVLLNRLHQGEPMRPGLAVSTLSAIASYQVCPVKLVSELFNTAMFQKAGKGGKAPQRLRRLPPYALADVALAVTDLHTHCSEGLGKLPNILPIVKQATAEAISAAPESFTADDLEKLRHFCVVNSHKDIVYDVMKLLKQRSAEQPPPSAHASLSRARAAELASYLASRRGDSSDGSSSSGPGYKHGQSRNKDLLSKDAPLPLAAVRSPSPHVGQAVVLEFDDDFCAEVGLNSPVAMSDVARPAQPTQPNVARNSAVPRNRKVPQDSAMQAVHSDSESTSDEGADFAAALPSKPSVPASASVFAIVDSKKQSAAEQARITSRSKEHQPKPPLHRPKKPVHASADPSARSFGAGVVLPAGPGGSARIDDKDDSIAGNRENAWRDAHDIAHGKLDAFELAELERFEQLMRDDARYSGLSKKYAGQESADEGILQAGAVKDEQPVVTAPLKPRPSHTPVQTEEGATLNQQAIEAAAAEFRVSGGPIAPPEVTPANTAGPVGSASAPQPLSAEDASLRDAAAWPAALKAEDASRSQRAAAADAAGAPESSQGGAVSWLEQIRREGKTRPRKKASSTPKGTRNATADADGSIQSSSSRASNRSQAGVKVSNGAAPSGAADKIQSVESAAPEKVQGSQPDDEVDVWTAGEGDVPSLVRNDSNYVTAESPQVRPAPHTAQSEEAKATADRSESGEIVFDTQGQPKVVMNGQLAKDVKRARNASAATPAAPEERKQSDSPSAQSAFSSGTPTAAAGSAAAPAAAPPPLAAAAGAAAACAEAPASTAAAPGNTSGRKAAPRSKVAPNHSFFGSNATVVGQGATVATSGKGARAAAVAKKAALAAQNLGSNALPGSSENRYKFPHFDKFAKRDSAVDMNLLTEITHALTPGTPLSSVASSPETALVGAGSQKSGPKGDKFKLNKAGGPGTRFKQNRATTATASTAEPATNPAAKPVAAESEESTTASKMVTPHTAVAPTQEGSAQEAPQAPAQAQVTSVQAPSAAADAVIHGSNKASDPEQSVPTESAPKVTPEAPQVEVTSSAQPPPVPAAQDVAAAAEHAADSTSKSTDAPSNKNTASSRAFVSAKPSARAPRSARFGPSASTATSRTPKAPKTPSSEGSASLNSMREEAHESPPQEFINKLHGDEIDDFAVTNASGAIPRRDDYTRPTSSPARSSRTTRPKASSASHSTVKQSTPKVGSSKAPTSTESKLAEALRKGAASPSIFDDGVHADMLKDVSVDSDDDFSSLELDQTPPAPASPKQTSKAANRLAAALQKSAAAAKIRKSASPDTTAEAQPSQPAASSSGGATAAGTAAGVAAAAVNSGRSKLHADGRPLRARAPRANAPLSAVTTGPEPSLAKSWRAAPAAVNAAASSWRADPEPAPSASPHSQPSSTPSAHSSASSAVSESTSTVKTSSFLKAEDSVDTADPPHSEAAAEAMRAAAEDLKGWEKAKTKAGRATAEGQRAANKVNKAGNTSAAVAARERMMANMRARAEATKKDPTPKVKEDADIGLPAGSKPMKHPPKSMAEEMRRVREAVLGKGGVSKKAAVTSTAAKAAAAVTAAAAAKPAVDATLVDQIASSDATTSGISAPAEPSVVSSEQHSDHLEHVTDTDQRPAPAAEIVTDEPPPSSEKPADQISTDRKRSGPLHFGARSESSAQTQKASTKEAQFDTPTDKALEVESTSLVTTQSSPKVEEVEVAEVVGKEEYARKQDQMGAAHTGDDDFEGIDMSRLEQLMAELPGSDDEGSGNPEDDEEMMRAFAEALNGGPMGGQGGGIQEEELREMWQLLGNSGEGMGEHGFDNEEFEQFLANGGMHGMDMEGEGDGMRRRPGRKAGQGRARRQEAKAANKKKKGFGRVGSR